MKIKNIKFCARKDTVYDIETPTHDYILSNGVISHNTIEMFAKTQVSGGTGGIYSSNNIWTIGKQTNKDGKEVTGHNFVINIEKSRYVKEKMKIPITVSFNGGIMQYSGLFDVALELGYLHKNSAVSYSLCLDPTTGEVEEQKYRKKEIEFSKDFWGDAFKKTDLKEAIRKKYQLAYSAILENEQELLEELDTEVEDL